MKIKFQAPKGKRIKKQFLYIELDYTTVNEQDWLWHPESKVWRQGFNLQDGDFCACNSCYCCSLKAALRRIKKWNFPKGTTFRLCSRWIGYDVYITK